MVVKVYLQHDMQILHTFGSIIWCQKKDRRKFWKYMFKFSMKSWIIDTQNELRKNVKYNDEMPLVFLLASYSVLLKHDKNNTA